jgi:AmmeMemoRadiSam system protein A
MLTSLDPQTRIQLLHTAREAIRAQAASRALELSPLASPPEASGVFVTVHVCGALRGCIGFLELQGDLQSTVAEAARRAAASDPRFMPVEADEFTDMDIDVTLLGALEDCRSAEAFDIGVHGLVIDYHGHRGLLLPQVAVERGWDKPEFLSALCQKARLPDKSWELPETRLFRFEGLVLREKEE